MTALRVRRFRNPETLDLFLRGAISLGITLHANTRIYGLHNKTLVFTLPGADTVTFSDPSNNGLLPVTIMAKISADVPTLSTSLVATTLYIVEASPSTGVELDGATSTAAALLGFPASTVTGVKYNTPDGATPRLITAHPGPQIDSIWAITEE